MAEIALILSVIALGLNIFSLVKYCRDKNEEDE